jgi:hypothetical protein
MFPAAAVAANSVIEFSPVTRVNLVDNKTDFRTAKFDGYYIKFYDLRDGFTEGTLDLKLSAGTQVRYYPNGDPTTNPITGPKTYGGGNSTEFSIYGAKDPDNDDMYVIGEVGRDGKLLVGGRLINENAAVATPDSVFLAFSLSRALFYSRDAAGK